MIALLVACGGREGIVDEQRPLDGFALGGQTFTLLARHRGWRHGAGVGEDGWPHGPYDAIYVSVSVATEPGLVRGDTDPTWAFDDRARAAATYGALAVERCLGADLAAWRVLGSPDGPAAPWRVLVPDGAGAAGGLVEADGLDCAGALRWAGDAATWRRDRAAHPTACAHLARMRLREDALRCLLREPPGRGATVPRRQDLPGALDDPELDRRLLEVLAPATAGDTRRFAPYRVAALLAEVRDRDAVKALAEALEPVDPWLPWQAEVVAAVAAERRDPAWAARLLARAERDLAAGTAERVAAAAVVFRHLAPDRAVPPILDPGWVPAGVAPPPCRPEHRVTVDRCPGE